MIIFLLAFLFTTSPAEAALCSQFTGPSCTPVPAGCDPGIFNYGVKCSQAMVLAVVGYTTDASGIPQPNGNANQSFIAAMVNGFKPITYLLLILYLVLFGYKIMTGGIGERDIKKESMIALVKFSAVAYFSLSSGISSYLYPFFLSLMSSLTNVFSYTPGAVCGDPGTDVWQRTDCILNYFYGLNLNVAGSVITNLYGIFAIIVALLFMGVFGWLLAALLVIATILIMAAFATAALASVMTILVVTFLLALGPVIIPLALFGQTTERMFKKWFEMLISYSIQPMIILGYLALMLTVLGNMFGPGTPNLPNPCTSPPTQLVDELTCVSYNIKYYPLGLISVPYIQGTAIPTAVASGWVSPWWNSATADGGLINFLVVFMSSFLTIFLLYTFMLNVVYFSEQIVGMGGTSGMAGNMNLVGSAMRGAQKAANMAAGIPTALRKGK